MPPVDGSNILKSVVLKLKLSPPAGKKSLRVSEASISILLWPFRPGSLPVSKGAHEVRVVASHPIDSFFVTGSPSPAM